METRENRLKITVLDDSAFYNSIITRQIESHAETLEMESKCKFSIESYAHVDDFMRNLKEDTDIAFVDYYLGNGVTGYDVMEKINHQCKNCKVVIISQTRNEMTTVKTLSNGASAFILKDKNALTKTCFFIDHVMKERFSA